MVYNLALRMVHDRELAEDLSQVVFMKAHKGLISFRGGSSLSTWIYRIAYNTAVSELQRARYRYEKPEHDDTDVESSHPAHEPAAPDPLSILERTEAAQRVRRLIDRLKPQQRLALLLYYQGGKSYIEISEIMEIPMGSVKNTIFRAKDSLRKFLGEEDR
jgi:RNA polymerase sigma-70 factor (ECF subfamily)